MPSVDFETTMRREVDDLVASHGGKPSRAFLRWYGKVALQLDDEEAAEATSFDGGNDRGVDFLYVDDEGERVVIAQGKYFQASTKSPTPAELALLLGVLDELEDPQDLVNSGRTDLADAATELRDATSRGYSIELHFVYPGPKSVDLERRVRAFNRKYARDDITAELVNLETLRLAYEDFTGAAKRVQEAAILINGDTFYEFKETFGRSIVANIPAIALQKLYQDHGDRLFDQNVRLYLGKRKGSVNAGITDTLENTKERSNFWAYNNGITIVANSFSIDVATNILTLRQFSIVNGCQTTVSLAEASAAAAEKASVLARVVAADPRIVDNIIRFTNSQNPIRVWDLSARDRVQQRLKAELEGMQDPWFYGLRRGEFSSYPDKNTFGPHGSRRVLPFPLSAQFLASARGLPVEAYKDRARLFTTHKDRVFPSDISAADLLWAWHIGNTAERAIDYYKANVEIDATASSILRRGPRFFVTAIAAHLLQRRNGEDVFKRCDVARLSDKSLQARLDKYANVAVFYYVSIVRTLVEAGGVVSVLVQNADTYKQVLRRVNERLQEEILAPKALEEKLPLLPGTRRRAN